MSNTYIYGNVHCDLCSKPTTRKLFQKFVVVMSDPPGSCWLTDTHYPRLPWCQPFVTNGVSFRKTAPFFTGVNDLRIDGNIRFPHGWLMWIGRPSLSVEITRTGRLQLASGGRVTCLRTMAGGGLCRRRRYTGRRSSRRSSSAPRRPPGSVTAAVSASGRVSVAYVRTSCYSSSCSMPIPPVNQRAAGGSI